MVTDHHEPIIDRALWNIVQEELQNRNRRNSQSSGHSNRYVFSGKMVCGECGARFISRSKTRKSGTSYMRWGCYTVSTQGVKSVDVQGNLIGCDIGKTIRDDLAMEALTKAIKGIPVDYNWIIQNLTNIVCASLSGTSDPMDDVKKLQRQIQQIMKKKEATIDAFVSGAISREELQHMKALYDERLAPLNERLQACKSVSFCSFCTDIGEQTFQLIEGHGVALGEVAKAGAQFTVGAAVLGQDDLGQLGIGVLDLHGVLEFFTVNKHGQPSLLAQNSQGQGSSSQR